MESSLTWSVLEPKWASKRAGSGHGGDGGRGGDGIGRKCLSVWGYS